MKHPTKLQMQLVIKKFESVLHLAKSERNFNILVPYVQHEYYTCGTVHCVAGWYAVACRWRRFILFKFKGVRIDFNHGANWIAQDLGFRNPTDLRQWARGNPQIWGNPYGWFMFNLVDAWNCATTLQEVIDHLKAVKSRLPK